ncbi:MAG: ABC transporter substrate-binding protein [Ideonella sp.]|nr:ABC transporter substrate-binding protein [Ideonella sp.]
MRCWVAMLLALLLAGAAAAQERVAKVGYLSWRDSGPYEAATQAGFTAGLLDEGFVEGRNLIVLRRSADNDAGRFKPLARELAVAGVDLFFAPATPMATAAWYAAPKTPIVIATILDPVALDFVKSLARPGTRVTGVTTMNNELTAKRLQLLQQIVPGLQRVGVIIDEAMRKACEQEVERIEDAARRLGLTLIFVHIDRKESIAPSFAKLVAAGAQAVTTTLMSTRNGFEKEYAEAALKARLPSMYELEYGTHYGGLASYGPDFGDVFRRAGQYAGRILKGADPAVMPVEEPRRFRLVVNLKTARALGIAVPQGVLVLADEVIE